MKEVFVFGNIGVGNVRPLRSLEAFGELPAIQFRDFKQKLSFLCYSSGTTGSIIALKQTSWLKIAWKSNISITLKFYQIFWFLFFFCLIGKPKGVETTHYNSVSNILQIEAVEKNTGNIWCDVLPMYHMFAQILFILLAPRLGVTTIVHSKFDFEVVEISLFQFFPFFFEESQADDFLLLVFAIDWEISGDWPSCCPSHVSSPSKGN